MSDKKEIINLGYQNGWLLGGDKYKIVMACADSNHKRLSFSVSKSITEYQCDICGYKYRVDSGD